MGIPEGVIRCIDSQVRYVVYKTIYKIETGKLKDEDHITGAFISSLEDELNNRCNYIENISIHAKAFSRKEESSWGADFAVILNMNLHGINGHTVSQAKGFLAQAKKCKCGPLGIIHGRIDFRRLYRQCRNMLENTASSFAVIYTDHYNCGFKVIPAEDVVSFSHILPHVVYLNCHDLQILMENIDFHQFFEYFLKCEVGDKKIARTLHLPPSYEDFLMFSERFKIGHLLYMEVKSRNEYDDFEFS